MPVPPGYDPDRVDESHVAQILGVISAVHFLAIIIVALRLYVRFRIVKSVGWDDGTIAAATLCALGGWIIFILQGTWGLGHHTWALSYDQLAKIDQGTFWMSIISSSVGIAFLKVSIAVSLMRLSPGRWYTLTLWASIVFVIAYSILGVLTFLLHCRPIKGHWDYLIKAQCYPVDLFIAFAVLNSSLNMFTDVLFATLPIPVIWKLQLKRRTRFYLIGVLSLGYAAVIIGILKSVAQIRWDPFADNHFDTWVTFWAGVQINIGIIAACVPALKPMFNRVLNLTTGRSHGYRYGSRGAELQTIGGSGVTRSRRRTEYGMEELASFDERSSSQEAKLGNLGQNTTTAAFCHATDEDTRRSDEIRLNRQLSGRAFKGIVKTTEVIVM